MRSLKRWFYPNYRTCD